MTDTPSSSSQADAVHVAAADGGETVVKPALTLEELNATLGSTFKDPSSALKSLKELQSFTGKRKEDIANEVKQSLAPSDAATKGDVQSLRNELFYSQNPQLKPYANMINSMGADPAEVVARADVKEIIEKAAKADEIAQAKSVVSSNSRLSQPAAPVVEQAVNVANARGTTNEDVAMVFAEAINKQNRGE